MKSAIFAGIALLSSVALAGTPAPTFIPVATSSIEDYCRSIVGDSYALMEACITQERQARTSVSGASTEPKIAAYCRGIVGDSYALQEACIQQENTARANISKMSVPASVKSYCSEIVGDSYALMEACIDQEISAKNRLGL